MLFYDYRLILVRFTNLHKLNHFYKLEFKNLNKINDRNIKIIFRKSSIDNISLYGYDDNLKYKTDKFTQNTFNHIFKLIDNMPMRSLEKTFDFDYIIKNKNTICGLPKTAETIHCFADSTHQTCCMLGHKAREYADSSGNPIGKASVRAFMEYYNREPHKNDLTAWCTCIGSKVCSYYAQRFNDGTHIKFINNPNDNFIAYNMENNCEEQISREFGYKSHLTLGINEGHSIDKKTRRNRKCLYEQLNLF